ncbi:NAD(P)-dependent oxidoreductase [Methylovirgula sp. 4M-Z18]|uniref:NAD(P)-dependent oxidoreductase n=1 Tax=Methylovirgula sp. 4M-Z18 TaxID=2293567 RepID=UPI000E2E4BA1|nr:NAD(P)-dependent oxidoreductase [Methylovirgula sp. 4M-Z18]RFB80675.1 NAD(P)-dependent oxidoreductase [Methylovirgula sp. 4M-Z18]
MALPAPIGFVGLGSMGEPMALNLAKAGTHLLVWNRTPAKSRILAEAGTQIAATSNDVFAQCEIVILMLATEAVIDTVLCRGTPKFAQLVAGRTLVNMATVPPDYAKALGGDIRAAGGAYVEAPVSGSRKPAEAGQLVAMLAGEADEIAAIRPLLAPMCRETFVCGAVPGALMMKLAVNLFLITMVTGLAEAAHFAQQQGLNLDLFMSVLNAGPMASDVSRVKLAKLVTRDFARQASIDDVLKNNRFVVEAAHRAGIASPLIDACYRLYGRTQSLGFGEEDMAAVIRAFEDLTDGQTLGRD